MRRILAICPLAAFTLPSACVSSADAVPTPAQVRFAAPSGPEQALAVARAALSPGLVARGIDAQTALQLRGVDELGDGSMDIKVSQMLRGVPVEGGEAIVHLDPAGEVEGVTDDLIQDIMVATEARLSDGAAVERAVDELGGWPWLTAEPRATLEIATTLEEPVLVWRVQLERIDGGPDTSAPVVLVDAATGEVLDVRDALKRTLGSGRGNYYTPSDLKICRPTSPGYYYLENTSRRVATLSMLGTDDTWTEVFDSDTSFNYAWQREAVDAHLAAENMLEYMDKVHNWNGLEGAAGAVGPGTVDSLMDDGTVLGIFVNYGDAYNGAFWYDSSAWIGDGDGVTWDPLATLDIVGHELGHGVTSTIVTFSDTGEPAAVDEAYADIFGAMAELYYDGDVTPGTWKIGEDAYTPGTSGDALRYFGNPAKDGSTVDHYEDYDPDADPEVNMGIMTVAYYMIATGGNHPTRGGSAVSGVGTDTAEAIAFRGLRKYSTASTDFAGTRNAWLDAATDLYGADGAQYEAVMDAWALVGVGVSSSVSTCTAYDHAFSGELAEAAGKYYPSSKGASYSAGTLAAALDGPDDADYDLFLQKKVDSRWTTVTRSKTAGSSTEALTYTATAGTYRVLVKATTGSGAFVACLSEP